MENSDNSDILRFAEVDLATKDKLLANRKAENTNKATKQWIHCVQAFLDQRKLSELKDIPDADLPKIIGDFYFSVRKKRISEDGTELSDDKKNKLKHYKNYSLKSGRAAINRYFKAERGIDIIGSDKFIQANEIFQAITRQGKEEGRGEIDSKEPIEDEDMKTLSKYFTELMDGPPNPCHLQDLVLFNIIYYCGRRRGCENLRYMTKDTFKINKDHDGRRYITQVIGECDKNHKEDDFTKSNCARIYENAGN